MTGTDSILIIPSDDLINVNQVALNFEYTKPQTIKDIPIEKVHTILWKWGNESKLCYYNDVLYGQDYREIKLTEDDYDTSVKPFVEQWQTEIDRIQEEQANLEAEYNKFENYREMAYNKIRETYKMVTQKPYLISSVGFSIDANASAYQAIDGLINRGETVENFMDYDNVSHSVTVEQLKIMRDEIVQQDSHLKTQKWNFLDLLEKTTTKDEVDEVLSACHFSYLNFSGESIVEIIL